jgi:hypothetical protein
VVHMITQRTRQQTACDGVRAAWHLAAPVRGAVLPVESHTLSIDGVRFDRALAQRTVFSVTRKPALSREHVTNALGSFIRSMDGIRLAPRL